MYIFLNEISFPEVTSHIKIRGSYCNYMKLYTFVKYTCILGKFLRLSQEHYSLSKILDRLLKCCDLNGNI